MYSSSQGCHTATGTHMPHGITQCYLPPGRGDIPAFTPAEAGTRLSDPGGMQGWVDLLTHLLKSATEDGASSPESGYTSVSCDSDQFAVCGRNSLARHCTSQMFRVVTTTLYDKVAPSEPPMKCLRYGLPVWIVTQTVRATQSRRAVKLGFKNLGF